MMTGVETVIESATFNPTETASIVFDDETGRSAIASATGDGTIRTATIVPIKMETGSATVDELEKEIAAATETEAGNMSETAATTVL